jgi:hypothetical protein
MDASMAVAAPGYARLRPNGLGGTPFPPALGQAARFSDGSVSPGKQGFVWRLDTADGSWAVNVPFHQPGEDEVCLATAFQEGPAPLGRCCSPRRDACSTTIKSTQVRVSPSGQPSRQALGPGPSPARFPQR